MFSKSSIAFLAVIAAVGAHAAELQWYNARDCTGSSIIDQRNIGCNTCQTPGDEYYGVSVSGVSSGQEISFYNEKDCPSASLVGQHYGDECLVAGATALKSVYIAC
ncbi:hypothetical protein BJ138DRAFT_1116650 [Hygrophoropsis aurantiaca]|uniref:Uncharacterized protein n=1 Tax=Hygrophoropsis aurantiaca TaxID=72124 RepID=A0ACB8A2R0_9AGAM|nr:hypothetical protein BJ138DRAFT_1116650 [Hygrophoropsis aurantiaca]